MPPSVQQWEGYFVWYGDSSQDYFAYPLSRDQIYGAMNGAILEDNAN
jgi:hypothetical protein